MDRWRGKLAIVTGASSGIGAAIVKDLLTHGLIVVGIARRAEKIEAQKRELPSELANNLIALKCDISKESEIVSAFAFIESKVVPKYGGIHILINNAGTLYTKFLTETDNGEAIRNTVETNLIGLIFCTREAIKSMKRHGIDGHVILMNSITGHGLFNASLMGMEPFFNVYPATKHGMTALTESYRQELSFFKSKIKVTSLSPGAVRTDIIPKELLENKKFNFPLLEPRDISATVLFVLGTPPHVQIHELIIKPVGEQF